MNYLPPQRNYKQMVRVVRDDAESPLAKHSVNYKLGNAFGETESTDFYSLFGNGGVSPTELQIRTLDSMNLPSSTARRPGKTGDGGILSNRSNSTLYHDLNAFTQDYVNGGDGGGVISRHDMGSGTKFRTQLSPGAPNKVVYQHEPGAHQQSSSRNNHAGNSALHPVESHFPSGYSKTKKHRSCSHSDLTPFE